MAARLNRLHQETVKAKIKGSQLVNVLQNHAFGETEMSPTQVQAAKILLDKIISNAPVEQILSGDQENPIAFSGKIEIIGIDSDDANQDSGET